MRCGVLVLGAVAIVIVAMMGGGAAGASCSQFMVSTTGAPSDKTYQAFNPKVAYNAGRGEAFVVWSADKLDTAFEIYGQFVDVSSGAQVHGDDLRISTMGTVDTDTKYDGMTPSVAFNPSELEYMVVWQGDMDGEDNAFEIFGQRVSETGALLGQRLRISETGDDPSDPGFIAANPIVTYVSGTDAYYVVWEAPQQSTPHAVEIYGRLIQGSIMSPVVRLSFMGLDDTDTMYNGFYPDVAYNSIDNQLLVVWQGEHLTHHAWEAYGQLVDAADGSTIDNNFQISEMGTVATSTEFRAFRPRVEYNSISKNYLIVWYGDTDVNSVNGVLNIYGQLLSAAGDKIVRPSFPISQMGPSPFDFRYDGVHPDLTYNPDSNEYLVVWEGDEEGGDDANEVYAQRLSGDQGDLLGDRVRISKSGADDTDKSYTVQKATAIYASEESRYFISWGGDFQGASSAYEIWVAMTDVRLSPVVGNFCPDSGDSSSNRSTVAAAVVTIVLIIVIGAVAYAVYKVRKNRKSQAAARSADILAERKKHADAEKRGKTALDKSARPGTRKVKVSRKKRSRKPPSAATATQALNNDPSYSYVSYETYTYEFDDDLSDAPAARDGAVASGSDFYSDGSGNL